MSGEHDHPELTGALDAVADLQRRVTALEGADPDPTPDPDPDPEPDPDPDPDPEPDPGAFALTAEREGADVRLAWTNPPAGTESFRVRRDGDGFATVAASATSYHDLDAAPEAGEYSVVARDEAAKRIAIATASVPAADGEPTPDPDPDPDPEPDPDPDPDPDPQPTTGIVGYGAGTTGGAGGAVIEARNASELKAALTKAGAKIVRAIGSGDWSLGTVVAISADTTFEADARIRFRDGGFRIKASNVICRNVRVLAGVVGGPGGDLDAWYIGDYSGGVVTENVVLDHCEGAWAPDVVAVMLGKVRNVTVQYGAFYEGLFSSTHPESFGGSAGDNDGHALGMNIAGAPAGVGLPGRITFYRTWIGRSQSRQPRMIGTDGIDFVECAFTGYGEGPQGAPRAVNFLSCTYGHLGVAAAMGLPAVRKLFRFQAGGEFGQQVAGAVYIDDANVLDFTPEPSDLVGPSPKVAPNLTGIQRVSSTRAWSEMRAQIGAVPRQPELTAALARTNDAWMDGVDGSRRPVYPPVPHG